eukprot:NODE_794_length_3854_cov_0.407082.p2 type:complete len:371 gc:universal NODE_794_length_3854_cov_0.407082:323-1435(+)
MILNTILFSKVMFIPTYGNSSDSKANIRFYGLNYDKVDSKTSGVATDYLNDAAMKLLQSKAETDEEKANLTRNIEPFLYWNYKKNTEVFIDYKGKNITVKSENDGRFDSFQEVDFSGYGKIEYSAAGESEKGNASVIQESGYGIIADIDDVLRVTEIWHPETGIVNTFIKPYVVVDGMPELFKNVFEKLPNVSYHYATTTPIPLSMPYIAWLEWKYPYGSLDMRPMDISDPGAIVGARSDQLERLFATFRGRKFVMVGDSSSDTLIKAYPEISKKYPDQLGCIFIRNITASYPDFSNIRVNIQEKFDGVPNEKWFVFDHPDDLKDINITSGNCHPPGKENQQTQSGGFGGVRGSSSILQSSLWLLLFYSI